ncbi:MAG TPA: protein kinase [Byssovorax sp.]
MTQRSDTRQTAIHSFARTLVDPPRDGLGDSSVAGARTLVDGSPVAVDLGADGTLWQSAAPPSVALPGEGSIVDGKYRLVRVLGEGNFGKVFVAQRLDVPEHQVALKLLPRSMYAGRNVERELVMLATVGHPNVVSLKDHGTTADYVWLTMPVYSGETLEARLERAPLGLDEGHDVFLAVARGLVALHDAGLRHQDVKPENIFLARFGELVHPILLDLGVAAEVDATFVAGTALYASPEQLAVLSGYPGAYALTEKMDTYCLATTLLRALVGPRSFPGEDAATRSELAAAQEVRASKPLADDALPGLVGPARALLEAAFKRWLAFEPSDRPTMSVMADELDVLSEPRREIERADAARRRRQRASVARLRVALGAFALVAIGGGAFAYSKRETLALAGELAKARREGAASFDRLDTCREGFKLTQAEVSSCRAERTSERDEYRASLENLVKSGTKAEQDRARELRSLNQKVRTLEERGETDRRRADDDARRVSTETREERERVVAEHERQVKVIDAARADIVKLTGQRDAALGEAKQCGEERDACKAAAAQAKPPAPTSTQPEAAAPKAP